MNSIRIRVDTKVPGRSRASAGSLPELPCGPSTVRYRRLVGRLQPRQDRLDEPRHGRQVGAVPPERLLGART